MIYRATCLIYLFGLAAGFIAQIGATSTRVGPLTPMDAWNAVLVLVLAAVLGALAGIEHFKALHRIDKMP